MNQVIDQKPSKSLAATSDEAQSTAVFKEALKEEKSRRRELTKYISKELVEGTDYGKIVGDKNNLLKPGAEKFLSLMSFTARFRKDTETWEMLGSVKGTIAYICEVVTKSGNVIGEGRGVCTVAERQNNANTAVKIAEKRALVDAILRTFSLSDAFTQDMEDRSPAQPKQSAPAQPQQAAPTQPKQADTGELATEAQKNYYEKLKTDKVLDDLSQEVVKGMDLDKATKREMSEVIDRLAKLPWKQDDQSDPPY